MVFPGSDLQLDLVINPTGAYSSVQEIKRSLEIGIQTQLEKRRVDIAHVHMGHFNLPLRIFQ